MRILPAIDLRDGKVVRLYQGDYDNMTVYGQDPAAQAAAFAAGFFAALLDGRSFADCARFANAAAAVSVEAVGASTGVQSAEQVMQRCKAAYHFPDFGAS